ncbi:MAG TPA: 50S ribosomal protein L6, partial [Candidatus Methanoperedenaceae archaeon]|nr:50S ribosomal protein L6 [Candidatus Methanoperedenaceae archaeon]
MEIKAIEISIPENITAEVGERTITVTGEKGSIERELWYPGVSIRMKDSKIIVKAEKIRKRQAAMVGTLASHIQNMIQGVSEGYTYRMKMVFAHFPIQLRVEGDHLSIANFLGEKKPRSARIHSGVDVKVAGDLITVTGINKED